MSTFSWIVMTILSIYLILCIIALVFAKKAPILEEYTVVYHIKHNENILLGSTDVYMVVILASDPDAAATIVSNVTGRSIDYVGLSQKKAAKIVAKLLDKSR